MYSSVFREWKVAALFVGGICLFVGAYFAEGGGYEQLEFGRKEAPTAQPVAVAAPVARPTAPTAARFTSDEELAAAFAEPSEAAPTPGPSPDAGAAPVEGIAPSAEAGTGPVDAPAAAPSAAPVAPAEQGY
jgi:hypothetical protein